MNKHYRSFRDRFDAKHSSWKQRERNLKIYAAVKKYFEQGPSKALVEACREACRKKAYPWWEELYKNDSRETSQDGI